VSGPITFLSGALRNRASQTGLAWRGAGAGERNGQPCGIPRSVHLIVGVLKNEAQSTTIQFAMLGAGLFLAG